MWASGATYRYGRDRGLLWIDTQTVAGPLVAVGVIQVGSSTSLALIANRSYYFFCAFQESYMLRRDVGRWICRRRPWVQGYIAHDKVSFIEPGGTVWPVAPAIVGVPGVRVR